MSAKGETKKWYAAEYPYDFAKCGLCIAMHARRIVIGCHEDHKSLIRAAKKAKLNLMACEMNSKTRKRFLSIRKQFSKFFRVQP